MGYTKEQKKEYFKKLREEWKAAKAALDAGQIEKIEAIRLTHGLKISAISYWFVARQMAKKGMDGIPYVDAKTYDGWVNTGFRVRKGEKSQLSGITWVNVGEENDKDSFMFPKEYHLFHKSQVEAIA